MGMKLEPTIHNEYLNSSYTPPGEGELRQLASWNATEQQYPRHTSVPQLIAKQAAATPAAVALVDGDRICTYKELNQRANQLAHYLQAQGVGPNVVVGLCVERSVEMVVGLLGILKAGGAYLPLDPTYPGERLAFMLEDARVPILVTQQSIATRLNTHGSGVVCLDSAANILEQLSTADPTFPATVNNLAYIIYTSGSTGRPKGVQIGHNSLLNLVYWHQQAFQLAPTDRATQLTSPAFDATGWELWPYLAMGASVYLLDDDSRVSPSLCRDWLIHHDITITFLPTTLAEGVIALAWPATTSLRYVLTGADTLHHYPSPALPFALINNYGPTEATVVATYGRVFPGGKADMPPSIGRPIANTQVYILDERMRQVPIGKPGELYIGGVGLALGYLNRPELTAAKFIAHPFSDDPAARLYRTGDMARFLPDGQIAFMGRVDYQIKIRGYRIEPGEIVSVLNEHPSVQTSLVVTREEGGEKRLVAYIVPFPGTEITANALREILAVRLPDYMIPSYFVILEALPLTPNGKVDRAALPAPGGTNTLREAIVTAPPSTPIEEQLVGILAPLLGLEQVGIDDNFFMLGGHSLLGTQLIARVAVSFGVKLTLRNLFNAPTVRQLSAEVERLIWAKVEAMGEQEARVLLDL
jgi:amino acid adenylation domain-containing protein